MYGFILLVHILAATVWTGGHLVLACTVLPRVLRERSVAELLRFESGYERIGIPALIIQVASGLWLASWHLPMAAWFSNDPVARLILLKLGLLAMTALFAVDARLRLIPRLSEENLVSLAWHVIPVTVISLLFVVVGVSFRTGWFY